MGSFAKKLEKQQARTAYKEHKKMYLKERMLQERLVQQGLLENGELVGTKFVDFKTWKQKKDSELEAISIARTTAQINKDANELIKVTLNPEDLEWSDE